MSERTTTHIRPEIEAVLNRLRSKIRRYVLLEGTGIVLVVLGVLFWVSLGLDWAYFQINKLELPVWFRVLYDVLAFSSIAVGVLLWIVFRLVRTLRAKALALVLERRFPELDDRLITAVETASAAAPENTTHLTAMMLERTIDDVASAADQIHVSDVFEKTPLRRAAIGAVAVVTSIAVFGITNAEAMDRWWRAFNPLNPQGTYWERQTELNVHVLAQPGDRIREFDHEFHYKHARGEDLALVVEVPVVNETGKPLTVPDRVELSYTLDQGRGSGRALMTKSGERRFKHTFPGLIDSVQFHVTGGDFTNLHPYRVTAVAPPRVDQIVLINDYADYTGLDPVAENSTGEPTFDEIAVLGTQVSIPMETRTRLRIKSNKPLKAARIRSDDFEIALSAEANTLTIYGTDDEQQRTVKLSDELTEPFRAAGANEFSVEFLLTSKAAKLLSAENVSAAVPLPADTVLRIFLEDTDDIIGSEPARLTVNGIVDMPPVVETELKGIGFSITRKAVIPMKGSVSDDYGVEEALFHYRLDEGANWQPRRFKTPPESRPKTYRLGDDEKIPLERFNVIPLDLEVGQKLSVSVYAGDADNLNGPHFSRGNTYTFKIVGNEELLSLLYGKELNLRRRFERIIQEVAQTQEDLILHRARVQAAQQLQAEPVEPSQQQARDDELAETETAVTVAAERALHQVRKNAMETSAVEASFRDILEELVNNAVHTRKMVERIDGLIARPLRDVNDVDFPNVDQSIGLFKLAIEKGNDPTGRIDDSVAKIATMLVHMKNVLREMRDLVKFHEAIKELKQMMEQLDSLSEDTKQKRKSNLLNKLKGLGLD